MVRLIIAVMLFAVSAAAGQGDSSEDALREAARTGDLARVEALLEEGVAVDAATQYGTTPLFFAATGGHIAIVQALVERGADVNAADSFYGMTVLRRALANQQLEIASYLLEHGATDGDRALVVAARRGDRALLDAAIATGNVHADALTDALAAALNRNDTAMANRLEGVTPAPPPVPEVDTTLLTRYVGSYTNDFLRHVMELGVTDGTLVARVSESSVLSLTPLTETSFVAESDGMTISIDMRGGIVNLVAVARNGETRLYRPVEETESREAAPVGEADLISRSSLPDAPRTAPRPWPGFRGPSASGVADGQGAATTWNAETGEHIAWKTPIPGLANSAPVIWGDQVFVTTAVSGAGDNTFRIGQYGETRSVDDLSPHSWHIYSLDRLSGTIRWERLVHEGQPGTKRHTKGSQANSTPVTDGEHVVAVFGAIGLVVCYDMAGALLWEVDIGVLDSGWFFDPGAQWGHSSSPIIHEGLVILQADTQHEPFVAALDVESGREVWRAVREDEISTFATPTVYTGPDGNELITNGTTIRAYDPATGERLWVLGPNSELAIATPVVSEDIIYLTAGYPPVRPVYAVRPGHRGDLSLIDGATASDAVAWSANRGGTYIPTPIVYQGYLYTTANNGRLTCYDARTGEIVYRRRIGGVGGSYSASPVAADGKLYFTSEDGDTYVVRAGPEYELLATNELGGIVMANPAVSDGMLVIRTQGHVYGIAEE